jgi:hypothetical protein
MIARLALFVGSAGLAYALLNSATTQTTSVCTVETVVFAPPAMTDLVQIHRIAWPFGTYTNVLPMIGGRASTGFIEPICMTGCADPPCPGIMSCDPNDLWWSTTYENLLVRSNAQLVMSDSLSPVPPVLTLFYDEYIVPSPTPTGRPTSTNTPQATPALPTKSPSTAPIADAPVVIAAAAAAAAAPCEPVSPSSAAGFTFLACLSALGLVGMCGCLQWNRRLSNNVECPYCCEKVKVSEKGLQKHLAGCKIHLLHFSPVLFDRVTAVADSSTIHIAGVEGEREDLVARSEARN